MALDTIYQHSPDVVARQILGETLLVPIRGELADLQRIFALNPVAQHIWGVLDGVRNLAAVSESVVARFEVEPEQAAADVLEFVGLLSAGGLIVKVS